MSIGECCPDCNGKVKENNDLYCEKCGWYGESYEAKKNRCPECYSKKKLYYDFEYICTDCNWSGKNHEADYYYSCKKCNWDGEKYELSYEGKCPDCDSKVEKYDKCPSCGARYHLENNQLVCDNCNWYGGVDELDIDDDFNEKCPDCNKWKYIDTDYDYRCTECNWEGRKHELVEKEIQIRDTVMLKSGSPLMTVIDIDEENYMTNSTMVTCRWFTKNNELNEVRFSIDELEYVE